MRPIGSATDIYHHAFRLDLRTQTIAWSRLEGDQAKYWIMDEGQKIALGQLFGVSGVGRSVQMRSRYGTQANADDIEHAERYVDLVTEASVQSLEVNPISGQYVVRSILLAPPPNEPGMAVTRKKGCRLPDDRQMKAPSVCSPGRRGAFLRHSSVVPQAGRTVLPVSVG